MLRPLENTSADFVAAAAARGIARHDALDCYRSVYRRGRGGVDWAAVEPPVVARTAEEDGTVKLVLTLADGLECETVIIPGLGSSGAARNTLCVSSQVGCAMGCTFCETARMGLVRDLGAGEIVGQWFAARFATRRAIRNVVFMGMGEPLDNLDAVIGAIEVLCDRNGPALAAARISVSTVGRAEGIRRLADLAARPGFHRIRLAVSVNAPNDQVRSTIMPLNRAVPMAALADAMRDWQRRAGTPILVEYVLIPGVNDDPDHARELCAYLGDLECTVNVIAYNPRRQSPWPAPTAAAVRQFIEAVAAGGQRVRRRTTRGRAVMAACGQLGNPAIRRGEPKAAIQLRTGPRRAD